MTLKSISAKFECDGCGAAFEAYIDPARTLPADWSMFDMAVDAVRGSVGAACTSVQGESNQCLCHKCTRAVDDFVTEDRNATDDEITAALERGR